MNRICQFALTASLFVTVPFSAVAKDRVFVPMGNNNSITIVDTASDNIIGTIKDIPAVHGLAGTPDGNFLVAGSYEEMPSKDAMQRPSGVSEADHNAHHAKPDMKAANRDGNVSLLSIIKMKDGKILRKVPVPGAVHHVAVSADSQFAAVTHPDEGTISIVNLVDFTVIETISTGPLPNYVAFGKDGTRLFVSNAGNNTVSEIGVHERIVLRNLIVGSSPEHLVFSPDGNTLYVNNADGGSVSVISVADFLVKQTIDVGSTLHGIDVSDDGDSLFIADRGNDRMVVVDLNSGKSVTVPLKPEPYHLATIRGSRKIYVSSADEPKIWVVNSNDLSISGSFEVPGKGHQIVQEPGS